MTRDNKGAQRGRAAGKVGLESKCGGQDQKWIWADHPSWPCRSDPEHPLHQKPLHSKVFHALRPPLASENVDHVSLASPYVPPPLRQAPARQAGHARSTPVTRPTQPRSRRLRVEAIAQSPDPRPAGPGTSSQRGSSISANQTRQQTAIACQLHPSPRAIALSSCDETHCSRTPGRLTRGPGVLRGTYLAALRYADSNHDFPPLIAFAGRTN